MSEWRRKQIKEIREILQNFQYEQHMGNMLVNLLLGYPSFQEKLMKAKEDGITTIKIGSFTRKYTKPVVECDGEVAVIHYNG